MHMPRSFPGEPSYDWDLSDRLDRDSEREPTARLVRPRLIPPQLNRAEVGKATSCSTCDVAVYVVDTDEHGRCKLCVVAGGGRPVFPLEVV